MRMADLVSTSVFALGGMLAVGCITDPFPEPDPGGDGGTDTGIDMDGGGDSGVGDAGADSGSGCTQDHLSVEVTGDVVYPEYASGQIVIQVCESESSWCAEEPGGIGAQTPGNCLAEQILDVPGAFSIDATLSWATFHPGSGGEPGIDVLVSVLDVPGDFSSCTAGGVRWDLPPDGCHGLNLVLEEGSCPTRE
jgi:hypothetical protein